MVDASDMFDRACLLQLHVRMWQGNKVVAPSVMSRLGDADWLKGRKQLVDPEHLASVRAVASRARGVLKKRALPFPIQGLTLVPKETIQGIESELVLIRDDFWNEVHLFSGQYQVFRQEAQSVLGDLFDETDYPMDVTHRFGFDWRYVQLSLPGSNLVLSPELYERERSKFLDLMESTRTEAMLALREEFAGLVGHMTERLTTDNGGKPKVLRSSMVQKMEEFLEGFTTRDLFQDESLGELVSQARRVLAGVDADILRNNESLRQRIHYEMSGIKSLVDASLEELPRRRIMMAA